jgi:putative endonuclease
MQQPYTVYIMASISRRLYVSLTGDLLARLQQHQTAQPESFTFRYRITRLVYFEELPNARAAIERETEIRSWAPGKKIQLIEGSNPRWRDLAANWFGLNLCTEGRARMNAEVHVSNHALPGVR